MLQPRRIQPYSRTLCTIIFFACFVSILKLWVSFGGQIQSVHKELNQVIRPNTSQVLMRNLERRRTLKRVCDLLNEGFYKNSNYYKSKKNIYIITDHYHRMAFCKIPKVSSSSWMRFFTVMIEKERADRDVWLTTHPGNWSVFGNTKKLRGLNNAGCNLWRPSNASYSLNSYFKFLAVRHPLQRLVSAYMGIVIGHNINQTFEDFLKGAALYIHTNHHWMPFINTCDPCSLDFDFIVNLETVQEDVPLIFSSNINAPYMVNEFPHSKPGSLNSQMYKAMYANVSKEVLRDIFVKFQPDADMFGYSFEGYGDSSQET